MANSEHLAILKQGVEAWNRWRSATDIAPDLRKADLSRLTNTSLKSLNLVNTDLSEANLDYGYLKTTDLSRAVLRDTLCHNAAFIEADLSGACLRGAKLGRANFYRARCIGTDFSGASLGGASLVDIDVEAACFDNCEVYGLSAWNLRGTLQSQINLIITPRGDSLITVDNIEVAQFAFLLLNNQRICQMIETITSKAVLILGRFTVERKPVLDAIRTKLRQNNYLSVLFDFEKPASRDITETVRTLAHMAGFVIADITDAKSIPQELMAIVPDLPSLPVQPLLLASQQEYGMFEHFKRYPWVLETFVYQDQEELLDSLEAKVIFPAEQKVKELQRQSA